MDFPKRIKQHKSQSDSFAILLYKLKDLGIFRSATENDYGIDFEIEIVHNERVIGKYLKAQVKSAEDVYIREDNIPTIGGIKQSTLLYWTELSFRTHVIAFAVDLTTEKIYFTKGLFWQATTLLDNSQKSKTISFLPPIIIPESLKVEKTEKTENFISTLLVKKIAFENNVGDIIYAHKSMLRNIKNIYELYAETWHYDAWTEVQSLDVFKTFLECSKILIDKLPEFPKEEEIKHKNLFNYDYWVEQTDWAEDEVSNMVAMFPMKIIMPLLLDKIQYYSDFVMKGEYYWFYKDMPYLKLVFKTKIPSERIHEKLIYVDYNYDHFENKDPFYHYIEKLQEDHNIK